MECVFLALSMRFRLLFSFIESCPSQWQYTFKTLKATAPPDADA